MSGASRGAGLPDRYQVVRLLGKGGMGKVYLAKDQETGRDVAVKVLAVPKQMLQAAAARFRREAKAQSRIESPNVVAIYDQQLVEDPPYLVMEYVQGRDVETVLKDEGRMPAERVVRMVREVAEAIDSLHEVGVIHRDLKPSNLMVREADGSTVLMDLGLAQIEGGTALTATGQLVGTPLYLPPESMDVRGWCFQSDIYQLGAIAFECLVGESLLKGRSMDEVVASLTLGEHREFPPALNIPPEIQSSIRAAVAVDPEERFQSAGEFARAMRGEGGLPEAPVTSTLAASVTGGPGVSASGPGQARLGTGAWAALLVVGIGLGAMFGRPDPAPAEPRWRVVADAVEVRFRPGVAEDIRAEVGDRLARNLESVGDGVSRLVVHDLPVGEPVSARLLWRGGEGPRVQLVATSPAVEDRAWLLTGRRLQVRLRRAAAVGIGDASPETGQAGDELVLPAPPADQPLPPLRWQEDGLGFQRGWSWRELYEGAAEAIPEVAILEDRRPLLEALRGGAPAPGVREAQRYWRQLVPWIPEILMSDVAPQLRHRVWRGWQALTHAVALEELHGLQVARPSVPVDAAGGRRSVAEPPEAGAVQWRPLYQAESQERGVNIAARTASASIPVGSHEITAVGEVTFQWPRVGTRPGVPVDVAFEVRKWRPGNIGRLEVVGGSHPFRVDIWHPEVSPRAEKYTGWLVVRLPPDLLPPTASAMVFRLLPVSGGDLQATWIKNIQLWRAN